MCALGSKIWMTRKWNVQIFLFAASAVYVTWISLQYLIAYEVQYLVMSEADYLLAGVIPVHVPSKLYYSQEIINDIIGVQEYVAALALRDMEQIDSLYMAAALNDTAHASHNFTRVFDNWKSFFCIHIGMTFRFFSETM